MLENLKNLGFITSTLSSPAIFSANEIEKTLDSYPMGRVAPIITLRLNKQIVELNGSQDRNEISKFIETMPIMDSKHVRNFLSKNEPRLDLEKEVIAPSGERVGVTISFGVEFFRPFF